MSKKSKAKPAVKNKKLLGSIALKTCGICQNKIPKTKFESHYNNCTRRFKKSVRIGCNIKLQLKQYKAFKGYIQFCIHGHVYKVYDPTFDNNLYAATCAPFAASPPVLQVYIKNGDLTPVDKENIRRRFKQLLDSHITTTSSGKKRAKAKNIENAKQYVSTNWKAITFLNSKICLSYLGKDYIFKYVDSRKSFQNCKKFIKHVDLKYQVVLVDGIVDRVILDDRVFRFITAVATAAITYDQFLDLVSEKGEFYDFSAATRRLVPYLGYRKFDYFTFLLSTSSETIYKIREPRSFKKSGSAVIEQSFLFEVRGSQRISWIWESMDPGNATYVFQAKKSSGSSNQRQGIINLLLSDMDNKRSILIQAPQQVLPGGIVMRRIFHTEHRDNFDNWKKRIRELT